MSALSPRFTISHAIAAGLTTIERARGFLVEGVRGEQGGPGAYRSVQNYVGNSQTREIV